MRMHEVLCPVMCGMSTTHTHITTLVTVNWLTQDTRTGPHAYACALGYAVRGTTTTHITTLVTKSTSESARVHPSTLP